MHHFDLKTIIVLLVCRKSDFFLYNYYIIPLHSFFLSLYSSLLAVSLDDFEIQVVDIDMRRVVRIFRGHTNRITDMVSSSSVTIPLSLHHFITCFWVFPCQSTVFSCFLFHFIYFTLLYFTLLY